MKTIAFAVTILALASLATAQTASTDQPAAAPAAESVPAIPATPAAVDAIVYSRKFTLKEGYEFTWCKGKPIVTSGYLLVLQVNPDLVFPRQLAQPVLYVGQQTVQKINDGYPSGHVIAIAPGDLDLNEALAWFGTPELPERVDAAKVETEAKLAKAAGIEAFSTKQIEAARVAGGDELKGATIANVLRVAADLIRQHAPQEKQVADTCVPAPTKPAPDSAPD